MFETQLDAVYAWFALALVSVVVVGVVAALPAAPPPDADAVAYTIDSVADTEYVATAEHGIVADRMRLTTRTVALASRGETASATLRGAPITPVPPDAAGAHSGLRRVLDGAPPGAAFDGPDAFAAAAERARASDHGWTTAPDRLTVRQVHYGEHRVTLVG